jgi:hypothetical protein
VGTSAAKIPSAERGETIRAASGEPPAGRGANDMDAETIELTNASIVAAALGLGIYIDSLV